MKIQIVGDNVIYGDWDAAGGYQFMVQNHPNGLDSVVFFFDGSDYGGGIVAVVEVPREKQEELQAILSKANEVGQYDLYNQVWALLEQHVLRA